MKYLMTLICILYLLCSANALAGWERTFGWIYDERAYSLKITDDKDFIVAGYAQEHDFYTRYFYLIKINADGDSIWARTYGLGEAYDVALTDDRGYIVAGYSHPEPNYYLLKTNTNGDTLWTRAYAGGFGPRGSSIIQTSDSGFYIAWAVDPDQDDIIVFRTDTHGDTVWTRLIGRALNDWAESMVESPFEGYIIVGSTSTGTSSEEDVYVVKIDSLGEIVWDRNYGGVGRNNAYFISATGDSCYIIAGRTSLYYDILFDVYLLKINDDGDTLWTRKYGGDHSDVGRCVRPTTDGGYIITGWTYSYGVGTPDSSNVYLIKTDSLGNLEWERTFGGTGEDKGYSVAQTEDGGFIIAGVYDQGPHTDVYLIKTDSLGYTQIEETYSTRPKELALEVYPNPFNSSITISLDFGSESRSVEQIGSGTAAAPAGAEIEIFDMNGRRIDVIPDSDRESRGVAKDLDSRFHGNDRTVVWSPDASIGSGVYLVRAKIGGSEVTKRVVYLK